MEIDFGAEKEISRVVLHIYDDHGGVQPPKAYVIQAWTGTDWRDISPLTVDPLKPTGGMANTVKFAPIRFSKFRIMFTHAGESRSGVTEVEAWKD